MGSFAEFLEREAGEIVVGFIVLIVCAGIAMLAHRAGYNEMATFGLTTAAGAVGWIGRAMVGRKPTDAQ